MIQFSIIIPHRNSVQYLPKLFSSIPDRNDLEIIVVDNSPTPVTKEDIHVERNYTLLYSPVERYAGGARNVGLDYANGKWILFLDADDYFAEGAFDFFYSKVDSDADIIFTGMGGVYLDTGEPSDRGDYYTNLIRSFINKEVSEESIRLGFDSPCCKMIRHDLVKKHCIRFDEIVAGNDVFFSLASGYFASKIEAYDVITYIATVSRGTLTKRRDFPVLEARLYSRLHYNQFVKTHGLRKWQSSVVSPFVDGKHLGLKAYFRFIRLILLFRQNPFIGMTRWFSTFKSIKKQKEKDAVYITKR